MAIQYEYACRDCGLSSIISPGDDAIMAGATRTGYCVHCQDFHAPILDEESYELPRALDKYQRRAFVCETHFSTPLVAWFEGMPCPRCCGVFEGVPDGIRICAD